MIETQRLISNNVDTEKCKTKKKASKYGGSNWEVPITYYFSGLCFENDFIFEILFLCYTQVL